MADVLPIKKHVLYQKNIKRTAAGVLKDARSFNPTEVVVIGLDDCGDLFVISSPPDPGNVMWLMERAKLKLAGVL